MKEEEEGGEGAVAVIVDRRLNPLRELQVILSDNRGRGVVRPPLRVGAVHRGEGRGGGKSTVACGGKRRRKRKKGGECVCVHALRSGGLKEEEEQKKVEYPRPNPPR